MKESRVWEWIDKGKPPWLAIERVEVLYPPGLSDCFWTDTRTGKSGWLELKYCEPIDKEYRAGHIPKLKVEQPMFMSRQARNGVPAGIVLRVGAIRWHVWRAPGSQIWNIQIRSREAISMANQTWNAPPAVADVMAVFVAKL